MTRIVFLIAATLCSATAFALTYVPVSDEALADGAVVVARVEFSSTAVLNVGGRVVTRYQATVLDLLKGGTSGSRLLVEVPGGGIETAGTNAGSAGAGGRAVHIAGAPVFVSGERAVLFLGAPDAATGAYRVLHLSQGAFREVETARGSILLRNLSESWELALDSAAGVSLRPGVDRARDRERFVDWLRDRSRGLERPADYLVDLPAAEIGAIDAKFTLLGPNNLTARWFVFDQGRRLRWFRQAGGQPGLAGGGKREFTRARKAWNNVRTPVRLTDGGTTAGTGGFVDLDGRSTILFRDVNDTIGFDFDCAVGGVLAIGGFSDLSSGARSYKDLGVFEAYEAEIVVNDGVECLFADLPRAAAQVYTHELGHTLGLGHSCGDGSSPRCERSALLADAVMKASLTEVFGARLGDDDVAGLRLLYDDEYFAAPCETAVPGGRRFCRRCGPCGAGQGNCRDDRDCAGILECKKNAGDLFGFAPSTNVCGER